MNFYASPAWSIKGKHKTSQRSQNLDLNPSPATYNPNMILKKSPAWKIGKEQRQKQTKQNIIPGPFDHANRPEQSINKFGIIGRAKRVCVEQKLQKCPGPADYCSKGKLNRSAPSITIASRINTPDKKAYFPGPGSYESKKPLARPKSAVIGNFKRFIANNQTKQWPGPSTYQNSIIQKSGRGMVVFGKAKKQPKMDDLGPGPGQYTFKGIIEQNASSNRGYSILGKHQIHTQMVVPSPASYSPSHSYTQAGNPSFTIPYACSNSSPLDSPGPASYYPRYNQSMILTQSVTIGKANKSLKEDEDKPGPADYIFCNSKKNSAKYSFTREKRQKKQRSMPGPADYSPNKTFTLTRPSTAKIGKSSRLKQIQTEMIPAPSTYSVIYNPVRPASPKITFTKQKRFLTQTQFLPGPADYSLTSTISNLPNYVK